MTPALLRKPEPSHAAAGVARLGRPRPHLPLQHSALPGRCRGNNDHNTVTDKLARARGATMHKIARTNIRARTNARIHALHAHARTRVRAHTRMQVWMRRLSH